MKPRGGQQGFTLLEVMIALAIMVVILSSAFLTQGLSISSSARNRNIVIATNLARNLINEQEVRWEGVSLERLPKTESANFTEEAYKDFKWTITYEEVDFSSLTDMIARQAEAAADKSGKGGAVDAGTETVLKVFRDYLKKAVRRMTVTIEWPDGDGKSTQTFTQLLVDHETELNLAI